MPLLTLKARRRFPEGQAELMARANAQADQLLRDEDGPPEADRVLVVYGAEAASIYYEGSGEESPRPPPRAGQTPRL